MKDITISIFKPVLENGHAIFKGKISYYKQKDFSY